MGGRANLSTRNDWTREEHILAFNLYCKIPFGTIHMRNPRLVELSRLLGRSIGSISYKLANFARLDPALQARNIKGMPHGAKGEEEVWREFAHNPEALAFESERLLANCLGKPIEEVADVDTRDLPPAGLEREAIVRLRVNQSFFRNRILSAYDYRCCITGLSIPQLLVTSHIIPWSEDAVNRLNPRNGLCLNALHDKAFDRHLMWIENDFTVRFVKGLHTSAKRGETSLEWLLGFEGARLALPKKFTPDAKFLRIHADRCREN